MDLKKNLEVHKFFSQFGLGETVYIKNAPAGDDKPTPGVVTEVIFHGGPPFYEVQWPNGQSSTISEFALCREVPV